MKTLIVYSSKHGTTQKVAEIIAEKLNHSSTQTNLKERQTIDLNPYEQIIIGGSIHAGMLQKRVRQFCEKNMSILLQKRVGLFLSCMDDNKAREQLVRAFPEILRNHAISCKTTGGEFRMDKMNFIERAIVKKVAGVNESVNNIKQDQIDQLVNELSVSHP
jgi:menaquinone-dependent protoporphyrinogen oxidase